MQILFCNNFFDILILDRLKKYDTHRLADFTHNSVGFHCYRRRRKGKRNRISLIITRHYIIL